MSYKIYKSFGHSHTTSLDKIGKPWILELFFDILFCCNDPFGFTLTALLAGLVCTISTSSMDEDFDCLLAPVTVSLLSPFLFKKFDNFNCCDVFTCLRMHTAHLYRFYTLNYFDFTLLSNAKMTFNMAITKIESMTEIIQKFWSPTSITLVVTILVDKIEPWLG